MKKNSKFLGLLLIPLCALAQNKETIQSHRYSSKAFSPSIVESMVGDTLRTQIQFYFRWDKDLLELDYMTNRPTFERLDTLLNSAHIRYIDKVMIHAYASPEGKPEYNQRLSERRGKEVQKALLNRYPILNPTQIKYKGMGENWEGLRLAVEGDQAVPSRKKVLQLLSHKLPLSELDKQLSQLDKGVPYSYLYKKHYRHLRNASSAYISMLMKPGYQHSSPYGSGRIDTIHTVQYDTIYINRVDTVFQTIFNCDTAFHYIRPIAVKTNLLSDGLLMPNIELEIPIGKRFSMNLEWTFPFWGGLRYYDNDRYTMQMLAGGIEGRYWFPRSKKLDQRAWTWDDYNPLNGFFVGAYAGAGLYDFQFGGNGIQGEFYASAGLTGGFAHPIFRDFHMEYSLGLGFLASQYYRYEPKDGHKVVFLRPDGQYDRRLQTWIGPTKLKVSFVWIPRIKVKGKGKELNPYTFEH